MDIATAQEFISKNACAVLATFLKRSAKRRGQTNAFVQEGSSGNSLPVLASCPTLSARAIFL